MTRLDMLSLQMRRSSKLKNFISDDWLFFWLLHKRETQVFEVASRSYLPMWERYQLEEAYARNLSERALEEGGARNDAPARTQAPCRCKGCTGSPGW